MTEHLIPADARRHLMSRRGLLAATAGLGAGAALLPGGAHAAKPGTPQPTDAEVWGVPTLDPLVERRADPFVTPPTDGMYFFTGSVPEYDRLVVRGAPTIAGLATAAETVIWRRPATGRMGGHIWAPELHRIDGRWYVYFAAGDSDDVFRIRMYVMESLLPDPRNPLGWSAPRQVVTPWQSFALDATTFAHAGRRYYVWAQSEPEIAVNTSLYIAEMRNPFELATFPARIATPTLPWETRGYKVNEGAAVLVRNGRVFMTYSASATDANYCVGLLTAPADADLLDPRSWTKSPEPVLATHEPTQRYGPGHNSFTTAEDGVTDVLVYHARDYRQITGDPLYDPNRHARVQKVVWHEDGTPMLGVPVGSGGPVVRLSPLDETRAFVRHAGDAVRVDRAPRDLGATQFRFVEGLAGAGLVSLQSVDQPDRYVVADAAGVRLAAVEPGTAGAAAAGFVRDPQSGGVSLRLGDGSGVLEHRGGQLVVGSRAGRRTSTFVLS